MKNKSLFIALVLVASICYIFSFKAQNISAVEKEDKYVTKFDTDGMATKYLADFNLLEKRVMWNRGRMFIYMKENDRVKLSIQVGLYPSAKEAEAIALDYMNYLSILLLEGPLMGEFIGDKSWYSASSLDQNNITSIVFLRNNALLIISSSSYKEIKKLAKSIDDDIINGESYISVENSISPPQINSISIGKSRLRQGDTSKITVNAMDPKLELLEYQFLPGLNRDTNDPQNVFTFTASQGRVPEPFFGSHTIRVVVINESNVVSPFSEIIINCIE